MPREPKIERCPECGKKAEVVEGVSAKTWVHQRVGSSHIYGHTKSTVVKEKRA